MPKAKPSTSSNVYETQKKMSQEIYKQIIELYVNEKLNGL
jgi:hypothetical protein